MKQFIKYDLQPEIKDENDYKINVEISPLELGMGTTIGNSLRRICLSSIPGVAPFAIRIEGVTHEFSSIKGVYEDVTEIILNIKKLVLKIDEEIFPHYELMDIPLEKWPVLKINKNSKGIITAENIICPIGFKIINTKLKICELSEDINFDMEIYATSGRGYTSFNENKEGINVIGIISVDSNFNPVLTFNYHVEEEKNSKSGLNDKLVIDLATNGSITPSDALSLGSKILIEHLNPIVFINEKIQEEIIFQNKKEEKKKSTLSVLIEELDLPVRAYNALKHLQIHTIQELTEKTLREINEIRNLGNKSIGDIIESLNKYGLKLKKD